LSIRVQALKLISVVVAVDVLWQKFRK